MIRTLPLICSRCGKEFQPEHQIYYQDDYTAQQFRDVKFLCEDCIRAWKEKWQIARAEFSERDYVLTVTITLKDGTVYADMDCTPNEDTESVVTGEDIPEEAQHRLYEIYVQWKEEQASRQLKDCFFQKEADGGLTASLTTYGGEHYEGVAVSRSEDGALVTDQELPDYIREGLLVALESYEAQEIMLDTTVKPRSQTAPTTMKRRQTKSQWPGSYDPFHSGN
ncbi:MAG: DUF4178 domain-containing protein [Succiniclasticum sp.]|jgi:hypothetical protein